MRIVIVDDTDTNLVLLSKMLSRLGEHEVACFEDPELGLADCLAREPDLLIVDYMMPKLDGIRFIERMRAIPAYAGLPILMVTAYGEREVLYEALSKGATDFVTKPVDRVEFTHRVRNMLEQRSNTLLLRDRAAWLAEEVKKATQQVHERERETIFRLARSAEFRDPETGAHIMRMAHYSRLIAQYLGWTVEEQDQVLLAAPMHDVGKLGTPDHILLKPGKLTADEFEIMKRHATIGHEILKGSSSPVMQQAAEIALTHHERFDGTGYPRGLKGEDIPLVGRVVAVADVFDALTTNRPYKKAWTLSEAATFMKQGRGVHFDPTCLDLFFEHFDDVVTIHQKYRDEQPTPYGPSLTDTVAEKELSLTVERT